MDASTQLIFDIVLGVGGSITMFVLFAVWNRLGKLEDEAKTLHVLVAGEYIKRSEVSENLDKIYEEIKGLREIMSIGIDRRTHP